MARIPTLLSVMLLLGLPIVGAGALEAADAPEPELLISELLPRPSDGQREFIELYNPGTISIALQGWRIQDTAGNTYTFDDYTLAPGDRWVVWGGGEPGSYGPVWGSSIWNNGGDEATLYNPQGEAVDNFTYGDAAHPAPDVGIAWMLDETWTLGPPTPGSAPGSAGGLIGGEVPNVAPTVSATAPSTRPAGGSAYVGFTIDDPNGIEDVASWAILVNGQEAATGSGGGLQQEIVSMPMQGTATVVIAATDLGGLTGTATVLIDTVPAGIELLIPPDLAFPSLEPGATAVAANGPITVRNLGETTLSLRLDISPLRGPGEIEVDDNLLLQLDIDGVVSELPYAGPLTPLPALAPGMAAQVTFVLQQVPIPLPAGAYGTTFTVVP